MNESDASDAPTGDLDAEVTRTLLDALNRVPGLRRRAHALGEAGPAVGSRAALDEAAASFGENGYVLASLSWLVASDHALAWQRLLSEGTQPMAAHATVLRSVFEGVAACRWLVQPDVSQAVRLQRACAAQLADYEERRKFEEMQGRRPQPSGTYRPARQRQAELRAAMNSVGVVEIGFPGYMALVGDYGVASDANGEWLYRLLSTVCPRQTVEHLCRQASEGRSAAGHDPCEASAVECQRRVDRCGNAAGDRFPGQSTSGARGLHQRRRRPRSPWIGQRVRLPGD